MSVFFRVISIIGVIVGFILKIRDYPVGDVIMKFGILILVLMFIFKKIKLPRHSTGTPF